MERTKVVKKKKDVRVCVIKPTVLNLELRKREGNKGLTLLRL